VYGLTETEIAVVEREKMSESLIKQITLIERKIKIGYEMAQILLISKNAKGSNNQ
jgi:hypothetical protein